MQSLLHQGHLCPAPSQHLVVLDQEMVQHLSAIKNLHLQHQHHLLDQHQHQNQNLQNQHQELCVIGGMRHQHSVRHQHLS